MRNEGYDDRDAREPIRKKGGKALISPPSKAVCREVDWDRNRAVIDIRFFGGDKMANSISGKLSGYGRNALVETTFSEYKKMFGERLFS